MARSGLIAREGRGDTPYFNGLPETALVAGMIRIARWIALALMLAIAVVTLGPISMRPMSGAPPDIERSVAFALLGGAIAFACRRSRDLLVGIVLAIVFAAL